jgi:hypothetical protein
MLRKSKQWFINNIYGEYLTKDVAMIYDILLECACYDWAKAQGISSGKFG